MQWPGYWSDLVTVSAVTVMVKKMDMTVDKSCEDCGVDLVSALESWGGNL